jgi:hypothetical protein
MTAVYTENDMELVSKCCRLNPESYNVQAAMYVYSGY